MHHAKRRLLRGLCGLPLVGLATGAGASAPVRLQRAPLVALDLTLAAQLRPGQALTLRRRHDLPHDPQAVELYHQGQRLGSLPPSRNHTIAQLLDDGQPLHAEVSHIGPGPEAWQRLEVTLYLLR